MLSAYLQDLGECHLAIAYELTPTPECKRIDREHGKLTEAEAQA